MRLLDTLQQGNIILYRNEGSWLGNRIEKAQLKAKFPKEQAQYTHVEVSLGGQHSVDITPPIVKVANLTNRLGRHIKVMTYKDVFYATKRYKIATWAATAVHLRYDIFGVLKFLIPFLRQNRRKFFCSEGVLWALRKEFPFALGPLEESQCMPAHFLHEDFFDVKYEGIIE